MIASIRAPYLSARDITLARRRGESGLLADRYAKANGIVFQKGSILRHMYARRNGILRTQEKEIASLRALLREIKFIRNLSHEAAVKYVFRTGWSEGVG